MRAKLRGRPDWSKSDNRPLWRWAKDSEGNLIVHTKTPIYFGSKVIGHVRNRSEARSMGYQSRHQLHGRRRRRNRGYAS